MEPTFHSTNVFGINVGSSPYISIRINQETFNKIKKKNLYIHQQNGEQLFAIKDNLGIPTGEMVFFIVFE